MLGSLATTSSKSTTVAFAGLTRRWLYLPTTGTKNIGHICDREKEPKRANSHRREEGAFFRRRLESSRIHQRPPRRLLSRRQRIRPRLIRLRRRLRVVLSVQSDAKESRDAHEHDSGGSVKELLVLEVEHPKDAQDGRKERPHEAAQVEVALVTVRGWGVPRWHGRRGDVHVHNTPLAQAARGQGRVVLAELTAVEDEAHQPLICQLRSEVAPTKASRHGTCSHKPFESADRLVEPAPHAALCVVQVLEAYRDPVLLLNFFLVGLHLRIPWRQFRDPLRLVDRTAARALGGFAPLVELEATLAQGVAVLGHFFHIPSLFFRGLAHGAVCRGRPRCAATFWSSVRFARCGPTSC
ncbi:unnamed protein product [Ixodes pacificus]